MRRLWSCAILALLLCATASADIIFTLDNPVQSALPGNTLTFEGSILNDGLTEVFLNGTSFNVPSFDIVLDDTPFFVNTPLSLLGGESFHGELFSLAVNPAAQPGPYTGAFSITGGVDSFAFDVIGTSTFDAVVTPEPSGLPFVSVFLLILMWLRGCGVTNRPSLNVVKHRVTSG